MADAPAGTTGKGLDFLKQKVGPLPLGVWLLGALGVWYYLQRQQASSAAASTTAGTATDPAGNTGVIDPLTGYVYDSPQDIAALQQQAADQAALSGATAGGTADTGTADTGTGTAAGGGATDTSGASGSGAPAGGPSATPAPVNVPPVNPKWSYPAPKGLTAYDVAAKGYRIRWTAVRGSGGQVPASYTVATYSSSGAQVDQFTTPSTDTAEYGKGGTGLAKGTYHTNVWANGGPQAPPHATVTVTVKG
jgi:hypothetical protein